MISGISWIVLLPLIYCVATQALTSELWVRRLLIRESPIRSVAPPQKLTMGPDQKTCPPHSDDLHPKNGGNGPVATRPQQIN
jgi:hypothetical protein